MTNRERILALRLIEKIEKNHEYAKNIGVQVTINKTDLEILEENND